MKINKQPIRTYLKECNKCGSPNPPKRNYCSDMCLFQILEERKKKTLCKIQKKKPIYKKPKAPLKKCKNCGELSKFVFCKKDCRHDFINNNRLRRPCRVIGCGKMFKPTGKCSYMCYKCRKKVRGYL